MATKPKKVQRFKKLSTGNKNLPAQNPERKYFTGLF